MRGGEASRVFAEIIAPSDAASRDDPPSGLIGLEHEFLVLDPNGVVDFRSMVRDIPLGGRRLDPADANAQRCAWGGVVTADGAEAEIATAPVRRKPGFVSRVERSAVGAREALRRALPHGLDLSGYSTHLSFSMPAGLNEAACRVFLSTFAPGVMLFGDRLNSPGLLVRPRPGRLELAFEYVDGPQLRGVTAFAAGGAIASARAVAERDPRGLPPLVRAFGVATGDRYGWGLTRDAFGADVIAGGRTALLDRRDGGTITVQDQLEQAWASSRAALAGAASERDLADADALVAGRLALASERHWSVTTSAAATDALVTWPRRTTFGDVLRTRERPGYSVAAEVATWDTTVFSFTGPWRRAYASVPRSSLPRFLRALDTGRLDRVLVDFLDAQPEGTRLASWSDAVRPGLFDALGPARSLVATEAVPDIVGGEWIEGGRPGKLEEHWTSPVPVRWIAVALVALLLLVFLVTRGGETSTTPPVPTTTSGAAPAPPKITRFTATFAAPVTSYQVDVTDPAGGGLTYKWTDSNPCGSFVFQGDQAQWIHPDPPCPNEPIHPGAIGVTATDSLGRTATYTYTGGSAPTDIRLP